MKNRLLLTMLTVGASALLLNATGARAQSTRLDPFNPYTFLQQQSLSKHKPAPAAKPHPKPAAKTPKNNAKTPTKPALTPTTHPTAHDPVPVVVTPPTPPATPTPSALFNAPDSVLPHGSFATVNAVAPSGSTSTSTNTTGDTTTDNAPASIPQILLSPAISTNPHRPVIIVPYRPPVISPFRP